MPFVQVKDMPSIRGRSIIEPSPDCAVLQEAPFTDQGSVVEVFADISVWQSIKKVIDHINANAVA